MCETHIKEVPTQLAGNRQNCMMCSKPLINIGKPKVVIWVIL